MNLRDRLLATHIKRIQKESKKSVRLKHTIYLGDRKIQQLGQEPIENGEKLNNASVENGEKLNNASVEIGDPMLPLARGNVIRRVDDRNISIATGTALRIALERDAIANNRTNGLGENGDGLPPNNPNVLPPNDPRGNLPQQYPPPSGCTPPNPECVWLNTPNRPEGYQSYGSAVINEDGLELYLYCRNGTVPASNLGCDFLDADTRWSCSGGVCSPDPNGIYATQAECEAALVPPNFTGGQCVGTVYQVYISFKQLPSGIRTAPFTVFSATGPITAIIHWEAPNSPTGDPTTAGIYCDHAGGRNQFGVNAGFATEFQFEYLVGSPDNCGDAPPTCGV